MWRKVILVKYGSNLERWRFRTTYLKDLSIFWRGIVENSKDVNVSKRVGNEALCWRVGNGRTTMFWVDIWCGNCPLKLEFPRLFRLVRQKGSMVANYSRNNVFNRLKWSELFTRSLLEREEEILCRLEDRVNSIELVPGVEDRLCWCERVLERGDHLFFKCKFIEGFWYKIFN
ncbi:hypothetical protein Goari_005670 [Gossypium aridum]|uniref:Reverse transcriptase zinc-binding domain-containing protein n=1 Tax=Gossypium aridum TaxID=34290 RepID=A0A7J8YMN9_GOSAI|nr:hypothetical protein [Gossypium aridum]